MRYVSVTYVRLTPVTGGKLLAAEAIWHLISHSLSLSVSLILVAMKIISKFERKKF